MAATSSIQLDPTWLEYLGSEFEQPYMQSLKTFLKSEKAAGKVIYPPGPDIFNAFNTTPLPKVRVVLLGQDPYHGPGQAHGLSFSVLPGVPQPPSLVNILKEIENELGIAPPRHGCLTHWAEQGVLLLNATLTVERGRAGSHQGKGWERFTDRAIQVVSEQCPAVVFLLWGSFAGKKAALVDGRKHLILKSPHPSPLSAHRGFFGNGHFAAANDWLRGRGEEPIDWRLPA